MSNGGCGKINYPSRKDAGIAGRKLVQRTHYGQFYVYFCRMCGAFHITSQKPRK